MTSGGWQVIIHYMGEQIVSPLFKTIDEMNKWQLEFYLRAKQAL